MSQACNEVSIKKVKATPFYDVFLGEGWKHWSRVAKSGGRVVVVKGDPLHQGLLNELVKRI